MSNKATSNSTNILYIPPCYENHFELTLNRFITNDRHVRHQIYTVNKTCTTSDYNSILSMCRNLIHKYKIRMLIADCPLSQLIAAKLIQEYPQIHSGGMSFLHTFKCLSQILMTDIFDINQCIPTLHVDITGDHNRNLQNIETFLTNYKTDGYMTYLYNFNNELSCFRFSNENNLMNIIHEYIESYKQYYITNLLPFFRVYISMKNYPWAFKPTYIVQPFLDLVTYPYWRLVIANACIFDKEIIMWPLADGYSGWPFLAKKPLAIIPIIVCPSRQITNEQQSLIYSCFRQHLHHLINNNYICHGWIQCSYFISCINEIRLISIKPICSIYLVEAFNVISQHGYPLRALIDVVNHQRPTTPVLNGKTVYIHRLWLDVQDKYLLNDLIYVNEIKRIHRAKISLNCYVHLRYQENDIINDDNKHTFTEIGFILVHGEYFEIGLTNLLEFRYRLLKKPELFPFVHHSMLSHNPHQFDPVTCLPSNELINKLTDYQNREHKDLI